MSPIDSLSLRRPRPLLTTWAAAIAAVVVLLGSPAIAQTTIRFSLDSRFTGPTAPFLVAVDKGYFKAEGLDVAVDPATNPLEPITRVAAGTYDMAFADINLLVKARDANPSGAGKAVFMVYNKPAYAIIARKSRGVEKPKDLENKSLGAPAADPAFAPWKIFAKANDIDTAKVKIENVGFPVREPMLQSGQVDAITGLSFSSFVDLKSMNVPVNDMVVLLMADHGVSLYGNAIIVNPKFAADKPDAVKGFLRAVVRGLKDTVKNPSSAVDSVIRRNDQARKPVELERLGMAIKDNILTAEVKANGYGAVDSDRLAKSIDQLGLTFDIRNKAKAAEAFDGSFLPPAADRKAN